MSDNSIFSSQAFPVSGIETSGAISRLSGDSANSPPANETTLAQKGGKRRKSRKGGKSRKSRKYRKSKKSRK